jgi:hypothetical protein
LMPGSSERTFVTLAIDDTALNLAVVKARGAAKGHPTSGRTCVGMVQAA